MAILHEYIVWQPGTKILCAQGSQGSFHYENILNAIAEYPCAYCIDYIGPSRTTIALGNDKNKQVKLS